MRIEIKFALVSISLGATIGFLLQYLQNLALSDLATELYSLESRVVVTASILILNAVTLFVFYALGRTKVPRFRTGLLVLVTYAASLAGSIAGLTAILLVPIGNVRVPPLFSDPSALVVYLKLAFSFAFIAFSGVAFARLRSNEFSLPNISRKTNIAIALIATSFFIWPSLWNGYFELGTATTPAAISFLENSDLAVMALPILQFAIFYYAGRKVSIVRRPFGYFGLLFIGAYIGTVLGALLSVTLYGQSQWSILTALGSTSEKYGIIFHNIALSPLLILESLIPVQSLPFLAFFAMSVSHLGTSESSQSPLPQSPLEDQRSQCNDTSSGL